MKSNSLGKDDRQGLRNSELSRRLLAWSNKFICYVNDGCR
jgi:hypothetical protein